MGFWTNFKADSSKANFVNSLHVKLASQMPEKDENALAIIACKAGLLANLAFADLNFEPEEFDKMETILNRDDNFKADEVKVIAKLAKEHAKEFSGLENHLLTRPLTELLTQKERFGFLKSLFQVAASDGSVSSLESEEVRNISHSLKLSKQHFLAARGEVAEFLAALK